MRGGEKKEKFMTALKRGFTLIELLIVIAILGVLAVVVLVAINPVQQLGRARDSGRISTVAQLGHAFEAFYTSHNGVYALDFAELVAAGEITQVPSLVNNTLNLPVCTGGDDAVNGWCYDEVTSSFAVWSRLEADTNLTLGACTTDAYTAYLSLAGRACVGCTEPSGATTVAWCVN